VYPKGASMLVKIKKVSENAILPARMTKGSAGFDLYAFIQNPITIYSRDDLFRIRNEPVLIPTGISIQLPEGYEAQLRPRSGLALKHGITILNTPATIDADYRGEIKVLLINHGRHDFVIENGQRIAQLIISKCEQPDFEVVSELDSTERNIDGFGSTGIK
jgi:dUTP pyrophosphatase